MKLPSLSGTPHRRTNDHRRGVWLGLGTAGALAAGGLLQAAHMRRVARDPEKEALDAIPEGRAQRVRSVDGTVLHVEVFGPEAGETVVLAHGWTETLRFWTYVIRGLEEKGLRVVAYDQRGHGDSEPASGGDYSIPRFGEDLEAVLAGCLAPGRRAVVAGHSLGAMSIASWAESHDVERYGKAAALLNTGVGDLVAENLILPLPCPGSPRLSTRSSRATACSAARRRSRASRRRSAMRRSATSHSARTPHRPRWRSSSACWSPARPVRAPTSASRCPRWIYMTRCRA